MLRPFTLNLVARRNADFRETYTLSHEVNPIDLTSIALEMQIRNHTGELGDPLIGIDSAGAVGKRIEISEPSAGIFALDISLENLLTLPAPDPRPGALPYFVYDLRAIYPDGFIEVLVEGYFITSFGVTI